MRTYVLKLSKLINLVNAREFFQIMIPPTHENLLPIFSEDNRRLFRTTVAKNEYTSDFRVVDHKKLDELLAAISSIVSWSVFLFFISAKIQQFFIIMKANVLSGMHKIIGIANVRPKAFFSRNYEYSKVISTVLIDFKIV